MPRNTMETLCILRQSKIFIQIKQLFEGHSYLCGNLQSKLIETTE